MKRLVVIPSDPISDYERAGIENLDTYYNPAGAFEEVHALSPLEQGERKLGKMTIRGVDDWGLRRAIRELRPEVVRAYGGYWPADFACRNRVGGVPVVVSVHDTNPEMIHRSVRYADLVLCVSKIIREKMIEKGVQPSRLRLLPNRVDLGIFQPVERPRLKALEGRYPAGKHILHVGRKCRQKNPETVIRALAHLPPEYRAVFIGMGETSSYAAVARELGVEPRCHWVSAVRNGELPLWYSWCDCMCTPSRWEGFGIVFIEAAACGAPIVTSDIAPMNEYLEDGRSACLVADYENPAAIAQAIQRVCEDASLRSKLSAGAREAAAPFERRKIDLEEAAIYREAVRPEPFPWLRRMERGCWELWEGLRHG